MTKVENIMNAYMPLFVFYGDDFKYQKDEVLIDTFEIKKDNYTFQEFRQFVTPGKYVRFVLDGQVMMSDTFMERQTNINALSATGDILIAGLGIGMVPFQLLSKGDVSSITIVENNANLIEAVKPILDKYDYANKVTIIHDDIWKFTKPGKSYDYIWLDIWYTMDEDIYEEEVSVLRDKLIKEECVNPEMPRVEYWMESLENIGYDWDELATEVFADDFIKYCN